MATTIALTEDGDLDLQGGRGPLLVTGVEAAQTFLIAKFATEQGEWGFNTEYGLPYNALVGRYFDETAAIGIYADAISETPSIAPLPTSAISFAVDPVSRKRTVTATPIQLATGESFDFEVTE